MDDLDVVVREEVTQVAEDGTDDSVCVEMEGRPLGEEEEDDGLKERGDNVEEGRDAWERGGGGL